ncbi:MAG: flagellar biosynthesis protein FlgA [Proteobacteria bacterium]|nr:flagellar biosynthesis protein FlgA [Pseudomonadota bacterium]
MNLHRLLRERQAEGRPVTVGLIGAGKFGAMFLAQARSTPGLHVLGIADLDLDRARKSLALTGWPEEQIGAASFDQARAEGTTHLCEDARALIETGGLEVVIDATGDPAAGIRHALAASAHGRHMIMVNVEADALAGPLLARRAAESGCVYSLAYGDQPALICEQVDWARAAGFEVIAAGKGTKYLPAYHASTPETVWDHYGFTEEEVKQGDFNPRMFNSFLDGTKSAIEMAAVCNATGLTPAPGGLGFPPAGVDDLADVLRPASEGGALHHRGTVEVISCLKRDGSPIERHLRWGVYVAIEAPGDYARRCFVEYGLATDASGRYSVMYRPYHLIGLELGISVASAALRGEATGAPRDFHADVVAIAKRDLKAGEALDGEGGGTVWGKLMPATDALGLGGLPIGLAHHVSLRNDIPAGDPLRWADVEIDETLEAVRVRREMEAAFGHAVSDAAE